MLSQSNMCELKVFRLVNEAINMPIDGQHRDRPKPTDFLALRTRSDHGHDVFLERVAKNQRVQ